MRDEPTSTVEIWRRLQTRDLQSFMIRNEKHFVDAELARYLDALRAEKGLVKEQILARADIESGYGHSIFRGKRKHPSRDKLIQLAFGYPMTLDELQKTLLIANKRQLHPKVKRDAAIAYALNKPNTLAQTQLLLDELGLTPLGEEPD